MDIDYFQKINNLYGATSKKESELYTLKQKLTSDFEYSPLHFDVLVNGIGKKLIISDSTQEKRKKIISKPDDYFTAGDIVEWQDDFYLIVEVEPNKDFYTKGYMQKCQSSLKWLDSDGIEHESYFTFKSDVATNFGIQDGRLVSLGNERRTVLISANTETLKTDKNKRFIFDGRCWRVSAVDTLSIQGIVQLTMDEDEMDISKDNLELRIADYYHPSETTQPPITGAPSSPLF